MLEEAGISTAQLPKMLGGDLPNEGYIHRHCQEAARRHNGGGSGPAREREGSESEGNFSRGQAEQMGQRSSDVHHQHFDMVIVAGAKEKLNLVYRETDEAVRYTLHVGGELPGMDIGFEVSFQPQASSSKAGPEEVETWARHGMFSDKRNVRKPTASYAPLGSVLFLTDHTTPCTVYSAVALRFDECVVCDGRSL
jgi:hypothetical protein